MPRIASARSAGPPSCWVLPDTEPTDRDTPAESAPTSDSTEGGAHQSLHRSRTIQSLHHDLRLYDLRATPA